MNNTTTEPTSSPLSFLYLPILFWYCFDDWLSNVTDTSWVGEIPIWVWCILNLPLVLFGGIVVVGGIILGITSLFKKY